MKLNKFNKKLILKIESEENFDFSKNTTYGCGGIAKKVYYPKNSLEAICIFEKIIKNNLKYFILGNGSNVLASQNFFDGVVVCTKKFKGIFKISKNKIYCLAGTTVNETINFCKKNSFGGVEFLYKIPATIGGLAYMNGGAGGIYLEKILNKVKIFSTKIKYLYKKDCNFTYKHSTMQDIECIILGIELCIYNSSAMQINKNLNLVSDLRQHLPKGRSCGCVFKNFNGISAGKIIEDCGLKGCRFGDAQVSKEHANFIINYGYNSSDVYNLIAFVKLQVYKTTGILLEEEVTCIGDF